MSALADGFFEEYRFLSNFWPSNVEYDGAFYLSVEHAFQAAKFDDLSYRELIKNAISPGQAKRLGRTREFPLREGWELGLATQVMSELVGKKFANHPSLKQRLLATGDALLVETNSWDDDTWGNSITTEKFGKNQLGIILMAVRSALRAAE